MCQIQSSPEKFPPLRFIFSPLLKTFYHSLHFFRIPSFSILSDIATFSSRISVSLILSSDSFSQQSHSCWQIVSRLVFALHPRDHELLLCRPASPQLISKHHYCSLIFIKDQDPVREWKPSQLITSDSVETISLLQPEPLTTEEPDHDC